MSQMSLFLVGGTGLFRRGLNSFLQNTDFTIAAEHDTVDACVAAASTTESPDLIVFVSTGNVDASQQAIEDLTHTYADARLIVLSGELSVDELAACLRAGARGYVTKTIGATELLEERQARPGPREVLRRLGPLARRDEPGEVEQMAGGHVMGERGGGARIEQIGPMPAHARARLRPLLSRDGVHVPPACREQRHDVTAHAAAGAGHEDALHVQSGHRWSFSESDREPTLGHATAKFGSFQRRPRSDAG